MMVNETQIKRSIKDYLKLSGWFVFPIMQGLGSYRGISDMIAIKNSNVLFIEVKTNRGKQSEYQIEFENNIKNQGGHYLVTRCIEDIDCYIQNNFNERNLLNFN